MAKTIGRLVWLAPEADSDLLARALLGDEISPPGFHEWLRAGAASRGAGVLMLRYDGANQSIGFCTAAPGEATPGWIADLRDPVSPEAAERRWGPLVGLVQRFASVAACAPAYAGEEVILQEGAAWRVRRRRHPSAIIDRLSARQRSECEERARAMFEHWTHDSRGGDHAAAELH